MTATTWLLVAAGGACGATLRFALQLVVGRLVTTPFPAAIFAINVIGSAAIGLLAGAAAGGRFSLSPDGRAFLFAGVLGGFTTFSSFSLDTLQLMRSGAPGLAALNVAGQVGLSLLAVYAGFRLAS